MLVNLYYFNLNTMKGKHNMKKGRLFVKAVSLVMAIFMTLAVVPVQAISLPQEKEDISNEIVSTGLWYFSP